jgi:hypothetical protein
MRQHRGLHTNLRSTTTAGVSNNALMYTQYCALMTNSAYCAAASAAYPYVCTTLQVQLGAVCQWRTEYFLQPDPAWCQALVAGLMLCPLLSADPILTTQHMSTWSCCDALAHGSCCCNITDLCNARPQVLDRQVRQQRTEPDDCRHQQVVFMGAVVGRRFQRVVRDGQAIETRAQRPEHIHRGTAEYLQTWSIRLPLHAHTLHADVCMHMQIMQGRPSNLAFGPFAPVHCSSKDKDVSPVHRAMPVMA